jgi:hypothetical protein
MYTQIGSQSWTTEEYATEILERAKPLISIRAIKQISKRLDTLMQKVLITGITQSQSDARNWFPMHTFATDNPAIESKL